jgi:hypothetical protein
MQLLALTFPGGRQLAGAALVESYLESAMLKEHTERAARYRQKAAEIRRSAKEMHSDSRDALLQLAHDYDLLAEKREQAAARIRDQSRH